MDHVIHVGQFCASLICRLLSCPYVYMCIHTTDACLFLTLLVHVGLASDVASALLDISYSHITTRDSTPSRTRQHTLSPPQPHKLFIAFIGMRVTVGVYQLFPARHVHADVFFFFVKMNSRAALI